ncbi:hypothetical protein IMAU30028_00536 [Lactobacillus helveticus]|nr:hypothetical protein [Lactobacillus helveticus]
MINLYDLGQVYIVCGRTDMRRGIDGLAAIVKDEFDLDPFSGRVFYLLRWQSRPFQGFILGWSGILAAL